MANEQEVANRGMLSFLLGLVFARCASNRGTGVSLLERSIDKGDNPIWAPATFPVYGIHSQSHALWARSAKWVVGFT